MKEYNIFLKNQPHGNLIIYMLPYWSSISPTAIKLLINSALKETAIKKLKVPNEIVIGAGIKSTLKKSFEQFHDPIRVDAGGITTQNLATRTDIEICTRDGIEIIAVKRVDTLPVDEIKNAGAIANKIRVGAGGIATACLETSDGNSIFTQDGDEVVAVRIADDVELYFRQVIDKEESKIEIVPLIGFSKYSSERFSDNVQIDSIITDTILRTFESCSDSLAIETQLDDIVYRIYLLVDNGIELDANISVSSKRKRWISEVADLPMAQIGAMSLQEFFYVESE